MDSAAISTDDPNVLVGIADELLAYGGQHRVLLRPLYEDEEGVFPHFADSAEGYELIDPDGRSFIDWVNGWGPVLLGYRHPAVEEAIKTQLAAGPTLSLMHRVELEVASMLTEMVPCAEMVAFGKNGSDALTAAIRVCRAATQHEVILQHGFHGFHDWYTCQHPDAQGIPAVLRPLVQPFPYNDLEALEQLFARFDGRVAAVVMEPVNTHLPEPGYLEGVKEMAHEHGSLLVFDEMVTGFRLANGGAQELFGVVPDLACFGKALANGMPLSAVVGNREHMQYLPRTAYGMTFRGETLSLAAARAVLTVLQTEPVTDHLARVGAEIRQRFHEACDREGVRCRLIGPDARLTFAFSDDGGVPLEDLRTLFLRECARGGVISNGNLLPSYAHDADAIERTAEAFSAALRIVSGLVRAGDVAIGKAMQAAFAPAENGESSTSDGGSSDLPGAFVELVREEGENLSVVGWVLFEDGPPDAVELVTRCGEVLPAERMERPDLAASFPGLAGAQQGGYVAVVPMRPFEATDSLEFTIRARRGVDGRFECQISRRRNRGDVRPPVCLAGAVLQL